MPRQIQLDYLPAGYAMGVAAKGESVSVRRKEFLTSEDGNEFITRLEGVSACFASVFGPGGTPPSQVDHFLAVLHPDRSATVYCNELHIVALMRVKRVSPPEVRAGEAVYPDDIADIEEAELRDAQDRPVEIPDECGVVLILSRGWRKCLFYDYSVLPPGVSRRTDHLPRLFGHFLARLWFQEMYSITDEQWGRLLGWGWFPFVGLKHADRKKLLNWASCDRDPKPVLEEISRSFAADLDARLEAWKRYDLLNRQMDFLNAAKDRYKADDYLSCISLLYPRIEGVMRLLFADENSGERPNQGTMVTNLVENQHAHSVLLPNRFEEYLKKVYFRGFDVAAGQVPLSRHSHGHGVSASVDYDLVRASVGFMVLDQLFHYLSD
jgi:hypothetical protein